MTSGFPLVIVPVLSKTTVLISLIVCIASPFLINIPLLAPIPLPTIKAVGVARPKAQGHAITKTETATPIALLKSPKINHQFRKVRIERAIIDGTNILVILSANF